MKILHSFGICVAYLLVLQDFIHASIEIIDSFGRTVTNFPNRYATDNDDAMEGYIESANPSDACTEISPPTFPKNYTMKKIVLINGTSTCDFMTKIQNAKTVGFHIAVLFDPLPEPFEYPNLTFPLPISEVNLSVVLVLSEDAIVIRNNYLHHNIRDTENFIIKISANVTWVTYLRDGFFCFLISIAVYVGLKCVWNSCVNHEQINNEDHVVVSIDVDRIIENYRIALQEVMREVLDQHFGDQWTEEERRNALSNLERRYPSVEFSEGQQQSDVCAVCFDDFEVGTRIRVLSCSHAYHSGCIDDWLIYKGRKDTCPLCIAKVNLENSCEQPPPDSTETTRLLISTHNLYSSSRTDKGSCPSESANDNPLPSANESGEHLAEAQGDYVQMEMNDSDDDDQHGLMV